MDTPASNLASITVMGEVTPAPGAGSAATAATCGGQSGESQPGSLFEALIADFRYGQPEMGGAPYLPIPAPPKIHTRPGADGENAPLTGSDGGKDLPPGLIFLPLLPPVQGQLPQTVAASETPASTGQGAALPPSLVPTGTGPMSPLLMQASTGKGVVAPQTASPPAQGAAPCGVESAASPAPQANPSATANPSAAHDPLTAAQALLNSVSAADAQAQGASTGASESTERDAFDALTTNRTREAVASPAQAQSAASQHRVALPADVRPTREGVAATAADAPTASTRAAPFDEVSRLAVTLQSLREPVRTQGVPANVATSSASAPVEASAPMALALVAGASASTDATANSGSSLGDQASDRGAGAEGLRTMIDRGTEDATRVHTQPASFAATLQASATGPATDDKPALTVHAPIDHPEWADSIGERIVWLTDQNLSNAQIRLNPAHLGPLEVRISVGQDQANVWISSHHAATREALEAAAPRLRELLGGHGLGNVSVNVSSHSSHQSHQQANAWRPDDGVRSGPRDWSPRLDTTPRAGTEPTNRGRLRAMLDLYA
jgi:flagellar hook-length control protein FliK